MIQSIKRTLAAPVGVAFLLFISITGGCRAQGAPADTAFVQTALNNALAAYEGAVGIGAHLYNGTEYVDYKKAHFEGNQFFVSKAVERGNIYYDGAWYTRVPMLYDLVTDEVVVPHNSSGLLMKLITEKIDTFQVHGHTFVRHRPDSTGQDVLQPGFYDVMYSQEEVQFLVKRVKQMQDKATPTGMEGEFMVGDRLYIRKDGQYHQVSSKGSVYKVFRDRKKELQKYAAANRLKFRKQREEAVLALTRYYGSLLAGQAPGSGR